MLRLMFVVTSTMFLTACTQTPLLKGISENHSERQVETSEPQHTVEISGWLPWWDWDAAVNTVTTTPAMRTISPFTYIIEEDGTISNKREIPAELKNKYIVIPTISHDLKAERLKLIMDNAEERKSHIAALVTIAREYDGIELDYENIPIEYRDRLTNLVNEISSAVKSENKKLYLALHAKTNDVIAYAGAGSLDYAKLCAVADKCRVMAYDYHYRGSPTAGAVTPIYWLKDVIEYSKKHIPLDKLVIALPLYGYEWAQPKKGESRTQTQIKALLSNPAYEQRFDERSQSPYLINGQTQLWYDNEQSLKVKMDYATSQGIYQFAFWRLGQDEDILNKL